MLTEILENVIRDLDKVMEWHRDSRDQYSFENDGFTMLEAVGVKNSLKGHLKRLTKIEEKRFTIKQTKETKQ